MTKNRIFSLFSGLFLRHSQMYVELLKVFCVVLRPANSRKLIDKWKKEFWARNFEVQNLVKKTFFWLKIELFLLVSGLFPRHFQIYLEVLKVFSTILRPTNPRKLTDRWKKDFWARNFKIQNLVNNFLWPKIELF